MASRRAAAAEPERPGPGLTAGPGLVAGAALRMCGERPRSGSGPQRRRRRRRRRRGGSGRGGARGWRHHAAPARRKRGGRRVAMATGPGRLQAAGNGTRPSGGGHRAPRGGSGSRGEAWLCVRHGVSDPGCWGAEKTSKRQQKDTKSS